MDKCKIRIEKKTTFRGVTYYYLYVNDQYLDLYNELEKALEVAKVASDVFNSGAYLPEVVYDKELTR